MDKYAVILAGGLGKRMENDMPKQFLIIQDKPVLYYTIRTFLKAYPDLQIILVLPAEYIDMGREIINAWFQYSGIQITNGGESRFHSVKNGLALVQKESIVFVHDGVRCLITTDLIHRCYGKAVESGSAIPVLASKDSVRFLTGVENVAIERDKIMLVQTPQTFNSKILLPAFEVDYEERFTDEATVVEAFGLKVQLVSGEENNIKITRPIDLILAEEWLRVRREI